MRALSIRQPWAWLIVNGHKDIENRDWSTKYRGTFLVHASKGMTGDEYASACAGIKEFLPDLVIPAPQELARGGIVGSAKIVDCVTRSNSPWFFGAFGFVMVDRIALPFREYRGQLGFFDVQPLTASQPH